MKSPLRLLAALALLGVTLLAPATSHAALEAQPLIGNTQLIYDTQNNNYWLWNINGSTDSTNPNFPTYMPTYASEYLGQVAQASTFTVSGALNWQMADIGALTALNSSASADPTTGWDIIVSTFQNSGTFVSNQIWVRTTDLQSDATNHMVYAITSNGLDTSTGAITAYDTFSTIDDTFTAEPNLSFPIGALYYAQAVPEPSTYILLFIALGTVAALRFKMNRRATATN